ncbi:MAG: sugar phosphate nucleotidyltransferase [Solirubrobacteraceae bacterium]
MGTQRRCPPASRASSDEPGRPFFVLSCLRAACVAARVRRCVGMQIAKALVLAGSGPQDRPWPSVRSMPKALVPVANRPILFHNLEALRRAGLLEATIAVDPETASAIRGAVGDGSDWDLTIRYLDCATDMGLGSALATARDFISDEPVLVQHAGALMRERIQPHIAAFADERLDALTLRLRPYPRASNEGEAVAGGWMLSERAVTMLTDGDGTAADPIAYVREQGGQARVQDVDGCLSCHGDQDMLLEANRRMLEDIVPDFDPESVQGSELQGPVIVHPTARVEGSLVRGPAIIGPRALVRDAYIGPYTAIGADVVLEGTEIEHSIVFPGAELRFVGTRLETSIIGKGARVVRSFGVPNALRLSIGDGAEVAL